jgi:hypothetical protein
METVIEILVPALLGAILLVMAILLAVFCLSVKAVKTTARDFLTAPDEQTPSPLAQLTANAATTVGVHVASQLKTQVMGVLSGESKRAKAIEEALLTDGLAETSPLLSGLLEVSPGLRKVIKKNPAVLELVMRAINRHQGSGAPRTESGSNNQEPLTL